MSIPNVSSLYQRINKGSEGGSEFARLMNYLLTAEAKEEGWKIEPYSDASGDFRGLDAYAEIDKKIFEGYQFKFFPSPLSASHKSKIIEAIKTAMGKSTEEMKMLHIVTPEDFMKEDKEWFEQVKKEHEKKKKIFGDLYGEVTGIGHWGHTRIVELMLRHPHISKRYFPELFSYEVDLFKLAAVGIDEENFIFDFSFTNDSAFTYLLHKIELVRLDSWSSMSGLPEEYYLKSLGELEFKVDMGKEVNELQLIDPLILKANSQMRFKIQLLDFDKTSPGNGIEIKFRFLFNNNEFFIETRPLTFSL
jgi:hypothetical protein